MLLSCQTEPMTDDSKADPLLAEAESISGRGSPSEKMYFRRWEKKTARLHPEKGMRIYERSSPADTKFSGQGKGRSAPGPAAESPLQPVLKSTVRKAVYAAHGGPCWSRFSGGTCDPTGLGPHDGAYCS